MNGIFRKVWFYFVCPWSGFSLTTSAEDIHTVGVWVKWCDLSLSWMGIRDFLLLGQYFFFSAFTRAHSSNGSTGLRAGCPSQLTQQIQHSPQHTECARMGPWGSAWFVPCVFDTVRTPVIGPFSVGALQTGSCSVPAARVLMQSPLHYFGSQMTEWLLPASLAHLQDFKWAKNENLVFSRALVKPHKC